MARDSVRPTSPAFRFIVGCAVTAVAALLVVAQTDIFWGFTATLVTPLADGGVTSVQGGTALYFWYYCRTYTNSTFADGRPVLASSECTDVLFNFDHTYAYDAAYYNPAIIACIWTALVLCAATVYLLIFAPLEKPTWYDVAASLAPRASTRTSAGTYAPVAGGSTWNQFRIRVAYSHARVLTLMRLEFYVPLLLLPVAITLLGLCVAYYKAAANVNKQLFIAEHSGVNCSDNCSSMAVESGYCLLCCMGASMLMIVCGVSSVVGVVVPKYFAFLLPAAAPPSTRRSIAHTAEGGKASAAHTSVPSTMSIFDDEEEEEDDELVATIPDTLAHVGGISDDIDGQTHLLPGEKGALSLLSPCVLFTTRVLALASLLLAFPTMGVLWWRYNCDTPTKQHVMSGGLNLLFLNMDYNVYAAYSIFISINSLLVGLEDMIVPATVASALTSISFLPLALSWGVCLPIQNFIQRWLVKIPNKLFFCVRRKLEPRPMHDLTEELNATVRVAISQFFAVSAYACIATVLNIASLLAFAIPATSYDWDAFLVKYVSTDLQVCNTFTVRPAEGVALILCSIMASACVTGLALHTARKVRVSLGAASMHLLGDSALEAERSHDTLGIPYALE